MEKELKIVSSCIFLIGFITGVFEGYLGRMPDVIYTISMLIGRVIYCIISGVVYSILFLIGALLLFIVYLAINKAKQNNNATPRWKAARDSKRFFDAWQKQELWNRQNGRCAICSKPLDKRSTQYDHITPWSKGGRTSLENGQALCANCHAIKCHYERKERGK